MPREKKDRYAFNANTKEVHLLSKVKPQCHLPEGASLYSSLEALAESTGIETPDRCGWCFRLKMKADKELDAEG